MMTPKDHMSQDLSYFSGPSTSGAVNQRSMWVGVALGGLCYLPISLQNMLSLPILQPLMMVLSWGAGRGEQPAPSAGIWG